MPNVGPLELAIVLIIALIVLGPKRLPEMAGSLGRGVREFKNSISLDSGEEEERDERRSQDRDPRDPEHVESER